MFECSTKNTSFHVLAVTVFSVFSFRFLIPFLFRFVVFSILNRMQYAARTMMAHCCDVKKTFTKISSRIVDPIVKYLSDEYMVADTSVRWMIRQIHTNKRSAIVKATNKDAGVFLICFSLFFLSFLSVKQTANKHRTNIKIQLNHQCTSQFQ